MSDCIGLFKSFTNETRTPARFYGVVVGIVTNNYDEDGLGRIKVKFPSLSADDESQWARVLTPMAGKDRGIYFLPEVDDEVLVAFENGDLNYPYILGSLWNAKDTSPETNQDEENNLRFIKSRSGHIIRFDDTDGEEKIEIINNAGSESIEIKSADNTITIKSDADITIESGNGKLILSGNGIEITSQADIAVDASGNMDLGAGGQLNINGSTVNIN